MVKRMGAANAAVLGLVAVLLCGCGLTGPAHGPRAANAAAVVTMGFESYSPAAVTIRAGRGGRVAEHIAHHAHRHG